MWKSCVFILFQVHGATIGNLENELKAAVREKQELENKLKDVTHQFEDTKASFSDRSDELLRLLSVLKDLDADSSLLDENLVNGIRDGERDAGEHLEKSLTEMERRYARAVSEISRLQKELGSMTPGQTMETEALKSDLRLVCKMLADNRGDSFCIQSELIGLCEALAQLYHHVCMAQGRTPDRVMLDHIKAIRATQSADDVPDMGDVSGAESGTDDPSKSGRIRIIDPSVKPAVGAKAIESLARDQLTSGYAKQTISSDLPRQELSVKRDGSTYQVIDTLRDQLKYLKRSMDGVLAANQQGNQENGTGAPQTVAEAEDLEKQNVKLRAMLSTKREQIATLRTVLKSNKQTAEAALSNLKRKYEAEKEIVSDTMSKLRHELKALKEDAATFASLRAMFSARCEEYQAQVCSSSEYCLGVFDDPSPIVCVFRIYSRSSAFDTYV